MDLKIQLNDGNYFEFKTEHKDFADKLEEIFKGRYYVLYGNSSEKGNVCIDTSKISYVEIL